MIRKGFFSIVSTSLLFGLSGGILTAQDTSDEEVFELSPFEVSTSSDSGYYASQTLAGGRINSQIEDIGTSVQVITGEFLDDLNAVNTEDILLYTTNTDVSGPSGNIGAIFSDGTGAVSDEAIRTNPAGNNRIRAVGSADLTRNFLRTDIPFDAYNSGRLDILRGANSFLFGLGSPAGIINYNLDRADLNKDFGSIRYRLTDEDLSGNLSHRIEGNYNGAIVKDVFAVRIAAVNDDQEYIQNGAFRDTQRLYGAFTLKPFEGKNIFIRASIEDGDVDSTPPSALGPLETLSAYLDNPTNINFGGPANRFIGDPFGNVVDNNTYYLGVDATGAIIPESRLARGDNALAARRWAIIYDDTVDSNGFPTRAVQTGIDGNMYRKGDPLLDPDNNNTAPRGLYFKGYPNYHQLSGAFTGWRPQGLVDYSVFDFSKNLITGGFDRLTQEFDVKNISLEATGWNNQVGLELVYNEEEFQQDHYIPIGNPTLYYDANRTHVIGPNSLFGDTNPNFGRVLIAGNSAGRIDNNIERETFRATTFAKLNFADRSDGSLKWLGRHLFTGLFDGDTRTETNLQQRIYAFGDEPSPAVHLAQPNATAFQRQTNYHIYVSPVQMGAMTDPSFQIQDFDITPRTDVNFNLPDNFSVPLAYYDAGDKARATSPPFGMGSSQVASFNPRFGNAAGSIVETEITSYAINSQSHFLNDLLVVNLGWREDTVEEVSVQAPANGPESTRNFDPEVFTLEGQTVNKITEDNFSYNFVAKVPDAWLPDGMGLNFHYGESSNFIPAAEAFGIDGERVPSGSGESKDYGFTLSALDDTLIARVNWYETEIINEPFASVNFAYQWTSTAHLSRKYGTLLQTLWEVDRNDDGILDEGDANGNGIFDDLEGDGNTYPTLAQLRSLRDVYSEEMTPFLRDLNDFVFNETTGRYTVGNGAFFALADTADVVAEGTEIEIIYNPTSSWRIAVNMANQKASRTNLAPRLGDLFTALLDYYTANPETRGIAGGGNQATAPINPNILAGSTMYGQLITNPNAGATYFRETALEGADNPEVRKWRFNAYTNFTFRDGRFKGVNVGAAYRYVDSATIGYGLETVQDGAVIRPDVNTRYNDDAVKNFDVWIGYRTEIMDGRFDWRIQLNIRNLFADSDPLVVQTQPDGSAARVRFAPPRTFVLQNTISF